MKEIAKSEMKRNLLQAQLFEDVMQKNPIVQGLYEEELEKWSIARTRAGFTKKELETYARHEAYVRAQDQFKILDDEGNMENVQFLAWAYYHTNIHPEFARAQQKILDYMRSHPIR